MSRTSHILTPVAPVQSAATETTDTLLARVAQAWLARGAAAFAYWGAESRVVQWPADLPGDFWVTAAGVTQVDLDPHHGSPDGGRLGVAGLYGPDIRPQLAAEAHLVARTLLLENEVAALTDELIDSQDKLMALYEIGRTTRLDLDIPQALNAMTEQLVQLLGGDGALLVLFTASGAPVMAQFPAGLGSPDDLLRLCDLVPDATHDEEIVSAQRRRGSLPVGFTAAFLKRFRVTAECTAVMGLLTRGARPLHSPALKLVRTVTGQTAAFLENALLLQERMARTRLQTELTVARQVQTSLLPRQAPHVPGLDIAMMSRPSYEVGGDFYDLLALPEIPFTFVIGDVSGKGISASLLMAMTRTVLRTHVKFMDAGATAERLARANIDLYDDFTEVGMFATIVLGQYFPEPRAVVLANAGHAPVIYCPAGEPARLLTAGGPPLGVLDACTFQETHLTLARGDLLVLATDGFSEATNIAGDLYGPDRLCHLVQTLVGLPAAQVVSEIDRTLAVFTQGETHFDDQTLLVLKGT